MEPLKVSSHFFQTTFLQNDASLTLYMYKSIVCLNDIIYLGVRPVAGTAGGVTTPWSRCSRTCQPGGTRTRMYRGVRQSITCGKIACKPGTL